MNPLTTGRNQQLCVPCNPLKKRIWYEGPDIQLPYAYYLQCHRKGGTPTTNRTPQILQFHLVSAAEIFRRKINSSKFRIYDFELLFPCFFTNTFGERREKVMVYMEMNGMGANDEEILEEDFNENIFFITKRVQWSEAIRDTVIEWRELYLRGPGYGT